GSSSIRMWSSLARDMAPLPVVSRGFGGAQMDAVLHYAPRVVVPYRPRAVVLNCGENDLEAHRGKTPERVMADVRAFVDLVAAEVPAVRFYLFAIKPSPARRATWPAAQRFNELLAGFCRERTDCTFVDAARASVDGQGRVREELFLEDGLHLSPVGYRTWTSLMRPLLLADAGIDEASATAQHGKDPGQAS
ncbi:MAG: GDSL-type esterase/lipase family protein, partial [Candidatus Binatia bacterium]